MALIRLVLAIVGAYLAAMTLRWLLDRFATWVFERFIGPLISAKGEPTEDELESIVNEYMDDDEYWKELETLVVREEKEDQ